MRVSDFIARFLADQGVRHVFTLTGGGAMFLNDAFAYEGRITPVYCHHEQACAMAAEGYARLAAAPGVVNVTTGPGGINALNGVFGAFTDSIPLLVVSGQVKRSTHLGATPVPGLRQLGDQEADIAAMARPVCKEVIQLFEPTDAPAALARAWALCQHGRPGPVWIDVPIDVQSADIDPAACRAWDGLLPPTPGQLTGDDLDARVDGLLDTIAKAQRPLFLWGTGVRLANQQDTLLAAAESLGIPVATAWTHDTIENDHPLFAGRPGTIGTRAGNFVLQSADLLVVLGSRLNVRQTSYNFESFARHAHIVQIDVDPAELDKPIVRPHESLCCDLADFAPRFRAAAAARTTVPHADARASWRAFVASRRARYPVMAPHLRTLRENRINPYWFVETLFEQAAPGDIFACGNATACIVPFQVGLIKKGTRLFSNSGSASMGYDLPAAIGAGIASPGRRVFCLAGDGSAQLNIQELQTLAHYRPDVKIIVLANDGYLSIRSSQANFFKRTAGESPASGVTLPDYRKLAEAYGLSAFDVSGPDFAQQLAEAIAWPGPVLIQVQLDGQQGFEPRMSSRQLPDGSIVSPELHDMHPFLEREEFARAMNLEDIA